MSKTRSQASGARFTLTLCALAVTLSATGCFRSRRRAEDAGPRADTPAPAAPWCAILAGCCRAIRIPEVAHSCSEAARVGTDPACEARLGSCCEAFVHGTWGFAGDDCCPGTAADCAAIAAHATPRRLCPEATFTPLCAP